MTNTIRDQIVEEAITWIGTPFHCMGRVKGVGVDCGQLLAAVYHAVGIIPDIPITYYPCAWFLHNDTERLLIEIEKYAKLIDEPLKGDIAVWKFGRCFSHAGIIVDDQLFIHSYVHLGCLYGRFEEPKYREKPVKYYSVVNQ